MVSRSLVEGSHALHDSFAVIRWEAAGIGPEAAGLLWSEAVVSELVVFVWLGRRLLDRLGPGGAAMLAGLGGFLRWSVMARTSWLPAMAAIEQLHGLTFALLVPPHLAARAQAFYGTVVIGAATSGPDAGVRPAVRRARPKRFSGDGRSLFIRHTVGTWASSGQRGLG